VVSASACKPLDAGMKQTTTKDWRPQGEPDGDSTHDRGQFTRQCVVVSLGCGRKRRKLRTLWSGVAVELPEFGKSNFDPKKKEERSKNFTKGGGIEAESSIMGCNQTNNGGEAKVAKNWVIYG